MPKTVVALYDEFETALAAIHALVDNGFSRDSISLIASDANGTLRQTHIDSENESDVDTIDTGVFEQTDASGGALAGAGVGAAAGGLGGVLLGLSAFAIPGIGPAVAAGPLATTLAGLLGSSAGAVAGGVTGGLLGALNDSGVPEEVAQYYAEGLRRGGNLVTVRTRDDRAAAAVEVLDEFGPVNLNQRASTWREFDHSGLEPETRAASEIDTQEVAVPKTNNTFEETGLDTYDE
jgi:hypothetical protein